MNTDNTNPFPGLRPFLEEEERLFFGRERQIATMINKLADTRFLAVVGASGSGKSSLVNCGLLPALNDGQMVTGGGWRMAKFRPGGDPLGKMADALAKDGVLYTNYDEGFPLREIIGTHLSMSKRGLLKIYQKARLPEDVNLLLVVDQFEELFRFGKREASLKEDDYGVSDEAIAFVNLLLSIREQSDDPIYVVLTMRSDFLGDCAKFDGLPEAINEGQFLVPRMTRDERRDAIKGPVKVGRRELAQKRGGNGQTDDDGPVGGGWAQITPVLLTRLVNDVGDNPDQLSILQHALNRTWARWENEGNEEGPLNLEHYKAIGTMDSALHKHAEKAYRELGDEDSDTEAATLDERTNGEARAEEKPPSRKQKICEKIFKALTDKFEGRSTRRPTKLGPLCALADASEAEVIDVIEAFRSPSRSFLMPPIGETLTAESMIDISHESLMRVWERLEKWTDEEAETARMYRRLAERAVLYEADQENLLRNPQLQLALDWRDDTQPNEAWATRYHPAFSSAMAFLKESQKEHERAILAEKAERKRELESAAALAAETGRAEEMAKTAEAQAEAAAQAQALAEEQRMRAEVQAQAAEQARALAEEQKRRAEQAHALAEEKEERAEEQEQAAKRLRRRLVAVILLTLFAFVWVALAIQQRQEAQAQTELAEEQTRRAEAFADTMATLADLSEARRLWADSLRHIADSLSELAQDSAAVAAFQREIAVRESRLAQREARLANALRLAAQASSRLDSKADLALLLILEAIESAQLAEAQSTLFTALQNYTHLNKTLRGHQSNVSSVTFIPNGEQLVSTSADSTIRFWDTQTGALRTTHDGQAPVTNIAVTTDGTHLATANQDSTVTLWDMETTGSEPQTLTGHEGVVHSVAFNRRGTHLASGSKDGTIRLWDADTGEALKTFVGHTSDVFSVAFSPTGDTLASGSEDNFIKLWKVSTGDTLMTLGGEAYHDNDVMSVAFSPDGARLASGSKDKTIIVWNLETGALERKLEGHQSGVASIAFSPDGARLASGSDDNSVILWDLDDGQPLSTLKGHQNIITNVAFSTDGKQLASSSADNTVRLWEIDEDSTGHSLNKPDQTVEAGQEEVPTIAFSPTGETLASGGYETIVLRDARSLDSLLTFEGHDAHVMSVAFSPDGTHLASGGDDGTIRLWDAETGNALATLEGHHGQIFSVAFNPDGTHLASGGDDGTIRLWDAETGDPRGTLEGHQDMVWSVVFSPDSTHLASSSVDRTIRLWNARTRRPLGDPLIGHSDEVMSLAFSPDGTRLASGSQDNTIRLWDVRTARPLGDPLTGHTAAIKGLAFSPDGTLLASGSFDQTIRLWDALTGEPLGDPLEGHAAGIWSVAFNPDGTQLASGSEDYTIRLWDVDLASWQIQACRIAQRNLTVEEWKQYMMKQEDRLNPLSILEYRKTCAEHPIDPRLLAMAEERATTMTYQDEDKDFLDEARDFFKRILTLKGTPEDASGLDRAADAEIVNVLMAQGDSLAQADQVFPAALAFKKAKSLDRSLRFDPAARVLAQKGRQRAREGQVEEAIADFIEALAIDPSFDLNPETEAPDRDPRAEAQRLAAPHRIKEGEALARAGKAAEAIEAFREAKAWNPEATQGLDPEAETEHLAAEMRDGKFTQGKNLAQAGLIDKAITAFDKALAIDPSFDLNPETEAPDRDPRAEAQRLAAPHRIKEGEALARAGKAAEAIEAFREAKAWNPEATQALYPVTKARGLVAEVRDEKVGEGKTLAREGNVEEAIVAFNEALAIDSSFDLNPETEAPDRDPRAEAQRLAAPLSVERGKTLARRGEVDEAIAAFEQAQAWDSTLISNPEAEARLLAAPSRVIEAEALARAGKLDEAIKAFTEAKAWKPALDINPKKEARRFFIRGRDAKVEEGKTLAREGNVEEAIAAFEQAKEWDPKLKIDPVTDAPRLAAPLLVERGRALARSSNVEEAIEVFTRAKKIDPSLEIDPVAEARRLAAPLLVERGRALARSGNVEEAIEVFEQAQEWDPSLKIDPLAEARRLAAPLWLEQGDDLARRDEVDEAIAAFEQAKEWDPTLKIPAASWNNLCWWSSLAGRAADVMDACKKAVRLDPDNGNYYDTRGLSRALTGNIEGAIEDFQFFVNWAPGTRFEGRVNERHAWIEKLQKGENPFDDPAILEALKYE